MAKDTTSTKERQEELLNAISTWISSKVSDPEHMPGTNNRMKYVLFHGIIADEAEPEPSHARSQPIKTHGQLVTGYLGLVSLVFSLRECEYYFRRYPFKGLPISRSAHLRNAAEMVCDRVAQFRDRVKTITNHLNQLYPGERIQVGPNIEGIRSSV